MSMDAMFRTNCSRWAPTSGMIKSFASEVELWKYFGSHAVSDCKQEMGMTPLAYNSLLIGLWSIHSNIHCESSDGSVSTAIG